MNKSNSLVVRSNISKKAAGLGFALTALILSLEPSAHAGTAVWNSTTGNTWNVGANWSGGTGASGVAGAADDVVFDNSLVLIPTPISLNAAESANSLTFGSANGPALGAFTLQASTATSAETLTLTTGDITVAPQVTGTITLGNSNHGVLTLATGAAGFTVANNSSQTLAIGAVFSGANNLSLDSAGGGTIILSGSNTATGAATIGTGDATLVQLGSTTALSKFTSTTVTSGSAVDLNGLALSTTVFTLNGNGIGSGVDAGALVNSTGAGSDAGAIVLGSASAIKNSGTALTLSGTIDDGYGLTVDGTGATTLSGIISDSGALTKVNTGTLTLTNGNTFSGGLVIDQGAAVVQEVAINKINYSSAGTGTITLGATGGSNSASLLGNSTTVTNNINLGTTTGMLTIGNNGGTTTPVFSGNVALGSNNLYLTTTGSAANSVTLNGIISGSGNIIASGPGRETISGANTFTGNTSLVSGTLSLGNASALGTGTLTLAAGTSLDSASNNPTIANAETWDGSFGYLGSSYNLTLGGAITMVSPLTLTVESGGTTLYISSAASVGGTTNGVFDITKAGAGTLNYAPTISLTSSQTANVSAGTEVLSGIVSGSGGLTEAGQGTLELTATNTYSGGTTIDAGGTVQVGAGTTGQLGSGGVTDNGTLVYDRSGTLTENNDISGSGSVVQTGTGTVTFSATSTAGWTGGTTINAGALTFDVTPSSVITINADGSLYVTSASVYTTITQWLNSGDINTSSTGDIALGANSSENINFSGYNNLMLGTSGNYTYSGLITAGSDGYFLGGGSGTLTVSATNALSGANTLQVGAINLTGTSGGSVTLTGANNLTGATSIISGTLTLSGAAGALADSNISVDNGATLVFDSSASGVTGATRAASVTLNGYGNSTLQVKGNATANSDDVITGALSIGSSSDYVTLTPSPTENTELSASSFSRAAGSVVLFRGTNLGLGAVGTAGDSNVIFTTAPTLTGGGGGIGTTTASIVLGAFGDTSATGTGTATTGGILTYGANGLAELTSYTSAITDGQTELDNVLYNMTGTALSTNLTAANTTINSLSLTESGSETVNGITISGNAGTTLNISSGEIFASQSLTNGNGSAGVQLISVPTLNFGSAEGIIFDGQTIGTSNGGFSGGLEITSVITGSDGLTIGGSGYVELRGANTYTGVTTVEGGRLILAGGLDVVTLPGDLVINSGGVVGSNSYTFSTTTNITINGGGYTGQTSNSGSASTQSYESLTMNGGTYVNGSGGHDGGFTLSGALTAAGGAITMSNTGTITVNGLASFSGGTLSMGADSNTTADTIATFNGGLTIVNPTATTGDYTPITLAAGTTNNSSVGAELVLNGGTTVTVTGNATNTNGVLIAAPTGVGAQGTVALNGGIVTFDVSDGAAPVDFTVAAPITDGAGAGSLTKTGSGTLLLTGASTYSNGTTLTAGTLDISGAGTLGAVGILSQAGVTISGGTLDLGGTTQDIDTLSVTGASTIQDGNLEADDAFGGQSFAFSNDTGTATVSANLMDSADPVPLTMSGAGTLVLSGSNTYSGGTTLSAGTTVLSNTSGSATGTGPLSVGPNATLAGTGTSSGTSFSIAGSSTSARANVLVGQTSPSDTNTTQNLTVQGSGASNIADANLTFNLSVATPGALGADPVGSGNELNVGNTAITFGTDIQSTILTLSLQGIGTIADNTSYVLIAGNVGAGDGLSQYANLSLDSSAATGTLASGLVTPINMSGSGQSGNVVLAFSGAADDAMYGANSSLFLYQNSTTGIDDIEVQVGAVPEPRIWAMLLGGFAMLIFWQRRRRNI